MIYFALVLLHQPGKGILTALLGGLDQFLFRHRKLTCLSPLLFCFSGRTSCARILFLGVLQIPLDPLCKFVDLLQCLYPAELFLIVSRVGDPL